ncbi:DNA-binding response regulator [Enterobacteriaceae bacterium G50]|nr:DNA-binding response regulator [Enterobacteriaceae bacterium G50]
MMHQYFLYDKNVFFTEGMKTVLCDFIDQQSAISCSDNFSQLVNVLEDVNNDKHINWILCDLDSLPSDRFTVLSTLKKHYQERHKKLVILLNKSSLPFFFALYSLLPNANWLLKSESIKSITTFFKELLNSKQENNCFSDTLTWYIRKELRNNNADRIISSDELWLIEEIFKGKSLSQIAHEVSVDVRRLSLIKRHLMRKLKIENNIALFNAFKVLIAPSP